MNVSILIQDAEKQHKNNTFDYYSFIILNLLETASIFSLLDQTEEIKQQLLKLKNSKAQKAKSANLNQELQTAIITQQRILSCSQIDEHVLILACLKEMDSHFSTSLYTPVLKEMLKKQLHRMENCCDNKKVIGRKKETEEITRILNRSFRNNILIIGDTGVGKTTLASSAQKMLHDTKVFQLFAGNDLFFDQIVSILSSNANKRILFFLDELFTFDVAHIKYLIDNVQIIATANESSYKKFTIEHPHIISKCEVINLEEPPLLDLKEIIINEQMHLQEHHQIAYENGLSEELIELAKKYMPQPAFPAKGLALLEESTMHTKSDGSQLVTKETLKQIIAQKTNIPIGSLSELDKKDLSKLPDKLKSTVKGQDEAVVKVAQTIQRSRLGFGRKNRPIGSFLFVGPSGVGKTELAKAIAQEVFGDIEAMVRLDMSEFSEAHMVQRLIGAPPGYIGYEEGGQLTNPVQSKPYTLVLLDEIEKAHPRVFDIFLQVLDDGRLTDGQGKKVDFTNTVIVATSNAGIEEILDMIAEGATKEKISSEIKDILQDYFRIEFINRFDDVIIFNSLPPTALKDIGKIQIIKLAAELEKRKIGFSISDESLDLLAAEAYDPRYGARGLLRLIQDKVENKLAEMIINGELKEGQRIEF